MPSTLSAPADVVAALYGFLCGTAGTGKTTIARSWTESGHAVLTATTGIAAVNLGDATTINSLLGYFDTASLQDQWIGGFLTTKLRKLARSGIRRIVLDETSMLDGEQLTILTRAIEEANGRGFVLGDEGYDEDYEPAGDLGLSLVGDFCQLAPVKAPYAFTSAEWGRYAANTCLLTDVYRQKQPEFLTALQAVRRGEGPRAVEYFRPFLTAVTDNTFEGTTIFAKNDAVNRYNLMRLTRLPTPIVRCPAVRWGKMRAEWGGEGQPEHKWGIPRVLELKEGCLVMILANHKDDPQSWAFRYVNGDLGTFRGVDEQQRLIVTLQRTGEDVAVEWITREHRIPLESGRRKQLKADGHADRVRDRHEVIGGVTYLPLRVAYGSTCHKSQGLTLDTVQINLRDGFWRTPGMLYVALSRCKTGEGLRIVGTAEAFVDRARVNPEVRAWL